MSWLETIQPIISKATPLAKFEAIDIQPTSAIAKVHRLAGPEGIVGALASQFIAIHDTINPNLDLKSWINEFEGCFPEILTFLSPELADKVRPWGKDYKDRPRIYIRNEDEQRGLYLCEFFPEGKDYPSEILFGNTWQIISQALSVMATNRQLSRYDLGAFLGYPVNDYLRAFPTDSIGLIFRLKTKPSNYTDPVLYKTLRVPHVEITKLDYSKFWNACGGSQGLDWGPICCRAKIGKGEDINKLHEVVAHGPDDSTAKANVQRFLEFSELKIRRFTFNRSEWEEGDSSLNDSYKVYPSSASILNTKILKLEKTGQLTTAGYKKSGKVRFLLRGETKPPDFDEIKNNLLQGLP